MYIEIFAFRFDNASKKLAFIQRGRWSQGFLNSRLKLSARWWHGCRVGESGLVAQYLRDVLANVGLRDGLERSQTDGRRGVQHAL